MREWTAQANAQTRKTRKTLHTNRRNHHHHHHHLMDWQTSFALAKSSRRAALRTCRLRHSQHLPQVSQLRERSNDEAHGSHGNSDELSPNKKKKKKKATNSKIRHAKGIVPAPRKSLNKTTIGWETATPATFVGGKLPALLSAEFFQCDALELAPKLLGKLLRRDDVVLQITEVEAYRPNDSACHGRFGITSRTAPVFGPGGHAYVYLCYGLHIMLNIVADLEGVGAAVLIRSCAPVAGIETIQSRRGMMSVKPELLNGPGKIGQALGLTTEWSNHPLYMPGGLEVLDGQRADDILIGPRVGIDYANPEDVAAQWRFAISGTPWISAPKNTLSPAPV